MTLIQEAIEVAVNPNTTPDEAQRMNKRFTAAFELPPPISDEDWALIPKEDRANWIATSLLGLSML